ncbi:MAG TPA: glycosyltransferase family A protein [Longimicrobiales bacterium]
MRTAPNLDYDEPAVSVIIPTYNRAAYLEAAVRSVLAQTHRPAEVIIVDDGSVDDTAAICMSLPEPVRYVRQENAGVSAARNRGLREAKGEYVALLDSDDVWHATKLETQLAALQKFPTAGWCTCACDVIDEHGAQLRPADGLRQVFPIFDALGLSPEALFESRLERVSMQAAAGSHTVFVGDVFELLFHGNFVLPSAAILHRRVIERVGLFDEAFRKAEETEFFHRVAARFPAAMIMTPLVDYRMGQGDALTSPSNTASLILGALESGRRALALRANPTAAERKAFEEGQQRLLLRLAYAHLSTLDRGAARVAIARAWETGAAVSLYSLGLYAASLLPVPVLRSLHKVKRLMTHRVRAH